MKTLFMIVLFLIPSKLFADTPSRWVDGVIQFAYGQIGSTNAWTASEYNQMVGDCVGSCVTQVYLPATWEVNLSTCIVYLTDKYRAFDNYSDWMSVRTRNGLLRKIQALRLEYDSMVDLPVADKKDLKQRYDWLKSYFQSLP